MGVWVWVWVWACACVRACLHGRKCTLHVGKFLIFVRFIKGEKVKNPSIVPLLFFIMNVQNTCKTLISHYMNIVFLMSYLSQIIHKDVCAIFLDVSKAFGKVWHDGLIFKLRKFGMTDTLFHC